MTVFQKGVNQKHPETYTPKKVTLTLSTLTRLYDTNTSGAKKIARWLTIQTPPRSCLHFMTFRYHPSLNPPSFYFGYYIQNEFPMYCILTRSPPRTCWNDLHARLIGWSQNVLGQRMTHFKKWFVICNAVHRCMRSLCQWLKQIAEVLLLHVQVFLGNVKCCLWLWVLKAYRFFLLPLLLAVAAAGVSDCQPLVSSADSSSWSSILDTIGLFIFTSSSPLDEDTPCWKKE